MPKLVGDIAHYDINDPEDLAVLVDRGLIWKGGPAAKSKAVNAILRGDLPRPANVPPDVAAILDRANVPESPVSDAPAAEPAPLDEEEPGGPPTP